MRILNKTLSGVHPPGRSVVYLPYDKEHDSVIPSVICESRGQYRIALATPVTPNGANPDEFAYGIETTFEYALRRVLWDNASLKRQGEEQYVGLVVLEQREMLEFTYHDLRGCVESYLVATAIEFE